MPARSIDDIARDFQMLDGETRLELLLDYARRLPPVPERLLDTRDLARVHECMTPVFLWMEQADTANAVRLYIDVAEEAPTVRGLMSIIIDAYDGSDVATIAALPADLLNRLGLSHAIRMQRAVGFSGIIGRLKRMAEAQQTDTSSGNNS